MPKTIKYESLAQRFASERDTAQLILMLLAILEDKFGPFFADGANKLYPTADGEPHATEYTKPV